MPPTKPTRASTSAILRCSRRRRLRRKENHAPLGPEALHDDARGLQPLDERRRQLARAEAVDHEPDPRAAARRPLEGLGHRPPGLVVGEDVGLEPDVVGGGVDRRHERREELRPVAQERHAIAGDRLHAGSPAPSQRREPRGERRVVGQARPGALREALRRCPPSGRARRCGRARAAAAAPGSSARGGPRRCSKTSARPSSPPEQRARRPPPVVEVAGHDQGRARPAPTRGCARRAIRAGSAGSSPRAPGAR